jgi:hypothetical protein
MDSVRRKLITHEDPYGVHKIFGIPSLCHIIYRSAVVLRRPMDDMGFSASNATGALLVMHLCLSLSSLVFALPLRRIKEGSRIWPEFRLHSIVFACRSLACLSLVWAEQRLGLPPQWWLNVVIVFATLLAADVATASVDPISRSSTIRDLEASMPTRFSFSIMQFLGTTGCLMGIRACAGGRSQAYSALGAPTWCPMAPSRCV